MDTKITQDVQAAKGIADSLDKRQPFWSSLIIRTMQQDLAAAGVKEDTLSAISKPVPAAPVSVSAPAPKPPLAVPPAPTPAPKIPTPIPPKPTPVSVPRRGGAVRPELISSLDLTPAKAPAEGGINWKKTILIVGILVAVFFSVGLWLILRQPAPSTSPSPSPSISISVSPGISKSPAPPSPLSPSPSPIFLPILFETEKETTITLTPAQEKLASQKIRQQFIQSNETAGTFTKVILKVINGEETIFGFKKIVSALNFTFFSNLISLVNATSSSFGDYYLKNDQSFLLFIYTQTPADSSPFSGSQNEGRLGLAAEFKDLVDLTIVAESLKSIESSLLSSASALFLNENINLPATINFSNNTYREIPIRYFNIAGPSLSLDYAFVGRKFIITTSRESMYAAIDRLLAK